MLFNRRIFTVPLLFTITGLMATGETWWSRKPLSKPTLPDESLYRNEVGRFIPEKLNQEKLNPSEEASPLALIRRVTDDLIGLPPSPQEIKELVQAYEKDSDKAYKALVGHLRDSPHYGEKYARHWLDVVKYADTCGILHGISEFGSMPRSQSGKGRDHNPYVFTNWLTGGGTKGGTTYGKSDKWGDNPLNRANPTQVYDIHATLLHLFGIDHERLTAKHNGIDRRLTDVHGHVINAIIA